MSLAERGTLSVSLSHMYAHMLRTKLNEATFFNSPNSSHHHYSYLKFSETRIRKRAKCLYKYVFVLKFYPLFPSRSICFVGYLLTKH